MEMIESDSLQNYLLSVVNPDSLCPACERPGWVKGSIHPLSYPTNAGNASTSQAAGSAMITGETGSRLRPAVTGLGGVAGRLYEYIPSVSPPAKKGFKRALCVTI